MENELNPISTEVQRPVRIGTMVWGLVLIALAALLIIARYTAVELDPRIVAIGTLLAAGLLLLLGGAFSALSKRRRKTAPDTAETEPIADALLNERTE